MTTLREAAQQALEALWFANAQHWFGSQTIEKAIASLQAALAQQEQEPVAWMVYTLDGKSVCVTDNPNDFTPEHRALPLYTAPPQRKPLTPVDLRSLYERYATYQEEGPEASGWWDFARAIERAHGIGGQDES